MSRDAQQISRQCIGCFADQGADESVVASTALGITRPDNKVIVFQKLFDDGKVFGIVGKIGVHGNELIVLMVDGVSHRHQMGRPQPQLGWAMDHMDGGVGLREPVQKIACSIRRVIVDYEDFRIRQMLEDFAENIPDVVRFVVCSGKNQSFWHGIPVVWRQIAV